MNNNKWVDYVEKHQPDIVGQFENQFGERFVIYRNQNGDKPYITGDELDWAIKVPLLWNNGDFMFSNDEREKVARILWPVMGDKEGPVAKLVAKVNELPEDQRPKTKEEMDEWLQNALREERRQVRDD